MNIEDKRYVQELCGKYYDEWLDRIMSVEARLTEVKEKQDVIEKWARDKYGAGNKKNN